MKVTDYIKEKILRITPKENTAQKREKAIKKLEETKDYLKHLLVNERQKIDDANVVALQAVNQTKNFLKLKKYLQIYEYWALSDGVFDSKLSSYDVAIVSHYRRLFDAIDAFLNAPEFAGKISRPFKKRVSDDIELMRKEWAEYHNLRNLIEIDAQKYFPATMPPKAAANCAKIFLQKNQKRLERLGTLIDRQRERFATLIADAEALLQFFK